ncbi:UDP-N-acetylmuramate dehydrogenase [Fusibacter paucivorans]|uniref:UDP-N-acetylenolpyruvoylglucosamine reductase n=1 Tax=Fusibacter paucivorans TaxID=76009 RepID=A0ABS5PP47_9FIRM|nr:UDP-N-acetylmuramate dehydrogenase [Fusibacter paucivorans]MBS7526944.1 UDP-N-acetylmuramate dehydrogenase [Fusibacter paucivorans]
MTVDFQSLMAIDPQCTIQYHEPLKNHTTFKIGGKADILIIPGSVDGIAMAIELCRKAELPYVILGNGSNVLVTDKGFRGAVIKVSAPFSQVTVKGTELVAEAGILLSMLANEAKEASLSGLAFASGIPGTLGGAIFMNAGAYGGEMKDVVTWVEALTPEGDIIRLTPEAMQFGYRTSIVKAKGYVVLRCGLTLHKLQRETIQSEMDDYTMRRTSKQPLELPSAGSTFKRPTGHFAGQLIETAGLRGLRYGDAQVSQKHCGFVVNRGQATCEDVLTLIGIIQKVVYDHAHVRLEREVQLIGE